MNNKALIAMSGGVDSSAAALLMKERGFDCIGVNMKLLGDGTFQLSADRACCSNDDAEDARRAAEHLGIPFYLFDFTPRFRKDVIDRFVKAYEAGMTPNPCIDCNRFLKFDELFSKADELGCRYIATGHYARTGFDEETGRYYLKKGEDEAKDQSYVLYSLTQEQLSRVIFPLGEMTKPRIRQIAGAAGLINASKPESQDICFVQKGKYGDFIEAYTGRTCPEGDFVFRDGTVAGRHKGIIRYTIGQRKGLGLALKKPAYVCGIDAKRNEVILGDNEDLFMRRVFAENINMIRVPDLKNGMRVTARVRYHQAEKPAYVVQTGDDTIELVFDEPQRAITPGQSLVMYDGDHVVGGGIITGAE